MKPTCYVVFFFYPITVTFTADALIQSSIQHLNQFTRLQTNDTIRYNSKHSVNIKAWISSEKTFTSYSVCFVQLPHAHAMTQALLSPLSITSHAAPNECASSYRELQQRVGDELAFASHTEGHGLAAKYDIIFRFAANGTELNIIGHLLVINSPEQIFF